MFLKKLQETTRTYTRKRQLLTVAGSIVGKELKSNQDLWQRDTQKGSTTYDVYAITPILVILRTRWAIALALCWTISSADISTAFLHAPLAEGTDLYLVPPIEF